MGGGGGGGVARLMICSDRQKICLRNVSYDGWLFSVVTQNAAMFRWATRGSEKLFLPKPTLGRIGHESHAQGNAESAATDRRSRYPMPTNIYEESNGYKYL